MQYNINKEIENQIYDAVNKIVDQYLAGKTFNTQHVRNVFSQDDYNNYFQSSDKSLKQAKKDFSKKSNLKKLLADIKYVGFHLFDQDEIKYKMVVKNILNDIIEDRIAEEKDKNNINKMKKLQTFENFNFKKISKVRRWDDNELGFEIKDFILPLIDLDIKGDIKIEMIYSNMSDYGFSSNATLESMYTNIHFASGKSKYEITNKKYDDDTNTYIMSIDVRITNWYEFLKDISGNSDIKNIIIK